MKKTRWTHSLMIGGLILAGALVCMWMLVELGYRAIDHELTRRSAEAEQCRRLLAGR